MVAAISTATETTPQNSARISTPPLLPSERENGIKGNKRSIRPRGREIPSRYLSPPCSTSTPPVSRRFPSPLISRTIYNNNNNNNNNNNSSSNPKRSQSVDRRRSGSAVNAVSVSAASKLLVTSTRSLSVSFQGESFSLPVSKTKAVNSGNRKAATPERRRATPERGKGDGLVDQQLLWPARDRQLVDDGVRSSFDGVLSLDCRSGSVDVTSVNGSDLTASDTDSVSSESSSGRQSVPRGITASARFWQETNMRLRRLQEPGSVPSSTKIGVSRITQSRKFNDGSVAAPRMMSSPIRGGVRSASPSKLMTPLTPSPIRGSSPSRVRSSVAGSLNGSFCDTPSVLSYIVDVRRGKVGENRIIDAHQLRLLYNRHLQWRFVNARTDIAFLIQKRSVEKNLWNAWITITGLRDSVRHKRAHLLLLKQKLRLTSILKGQVNYLDEWSLMDKDHSSALQGAIKALKASTLRLPVVGAAIADVQSVKEAVSSAVDVMQAMASSIYSLLTKVEEVNSLVSELVNVGAKERALLGQCKDVLSALAALEVKDCSLRTHILQLNCLPIA